MMPQQQGQQQPPDPMAMLSQQADQIRQQVAQHIRSLQATTTIDGVVRFLRDERVRSFAIEIQTDSTIMVDETAEKQSRAEFLQAFAQASAGVQQLLQMGPAGAELAGGMLKFSLAPYRVGRQLDGMIDKFVEQAPQIVAQQQSQQQGGQDPQMMQFQQQLAQAELGKAQAQLQRVQAEAQAKQAQMQIDMQQGQKDFELKAATITAQLEQAKADLAETMARTEQIRTETALSVEAARTDRQEADNDTARVIAEVGAQAFEQDQAFMQPLEAPDAQD